MLRISYKPLRVLLAQKDISRQQLIEGAGINKNTAGKLFKDVEVSLSTLAQVCEYLECRIEDVVEFIPEQAVTATYLDILPHIIDDKYKGGGGHR